MVAIITGRGNGLERSSASVLGAQGQLGAAALGRDGASVYVNAASGNLAISRQDEFLIGLGPDLSLDRSYNSQTAIGDGDNDDQWQMSVYRKVVGTTGDATLIRRDWDGSETVYTKISTDHYTATDGQGGYDSLDWSSDASQWTWTDGDSRITDTYDSTGKLLATADPDGNTLTYHYDGSLIDSVTTAGGDTTSLIYDTRSGHTGQLLRLETWKYGVTGAPELTRVTYDYDDNGRLSRVKVNLDAADNSASTGVNYVTTYTYDGSSNRIASISQSDNSLLTITYVNDAGTYKVASYTQTVSAGVTRATRFTYLSGRTIVTDPADQKTTFYYDGSNQLTQISFPQDDAVGPPRTVQFTYNGNGDVTSATNGAGDTVTYDYNGNGERILERDSAGNVVERDYGSKNELLVERHFLVPDPDGAGASQPSSPLVSRYAYDGENHLVYSISAEGRVTRYTYNSAGLATASHEFTADFYDVSGLSATATLSAATLDTWVSGISDKGKAIRTETSYDYRGAVASVTSWSKLQTDGTFDTGSGSERSQSVYVYDTAGRLLTRQVTGQSGTETFVYDGLGRMTMATDFNAGVTRTTFLDTSQRTVLVHTNGLSEVSTFDRAGELISFSRSEAGENLVDLTGWAGNLEHLPSGAATVTGWQNPSLTSEASWVSSTTPDGGQLAAVLAGNADGVDAGGGNLTNAVAISGGSAYEFTYYFKLNDLGHNTLYFGLSNNSTAYVENAVSGGSFGSDVSNPYFLELGSWEQGGLTAGKWYKVVGYVLPQGASAVAADSIGGVYDVSTGDKVLSIEGIFRWNSGRPDNNVYSRFFAYYGVTDPDSVTFYQPEIRQVATPGAVAGISTSTYRYDALGRLRMTTDPTGRRAYMMYDAADRKVADIDADGSAIEYRYDDAGHVTSTTAYANKVAVSSLVDGSGNPTTSSFASLRPSADSSNDRWSFNVYDRAGRLIQTIDAAGATSVFAYDGASRLVSTKSYANLVSGTVLTALKTAATTANLWTNPGNGALWAVTDLTVTSASAIDGYNASNFTVTATGFEMVHGDGFSVAAGDTVRFTLTMMGVGAVTSNSFGIYGDAAGWGSDGDFSATIDSGQGSLVQTGGGLWRVDGLSTSTATRITITRKVGASGSVTPVAYVTDNGNSTAGQAMILSAPLVTVTPNAPVGLPSADATNDRVARNFYDGDGKLIGTLDAEGYLTRIVYDQAGRKIQTLAYANATTTTYRASGTFAQNLGTVTADAANDIRNHFVYDARGFLRAVIDGEGDVTRYDYHPLGFVSQIVTGQKLVPADLVTTPPTLANLAAPGSGEILRTVSYTLDLYGRVTQETASLTGSTTTVTSHSYDAMGRLVSTTTQAGSGPDPRTQTWRYDLRGRLTGTMAGIGNATLSSPTQSQIDAAYAEYGDVYTYDSADRITSSTDPDGNKTLYYYNADGDLAYQIDALGDVVEYRYDTFGDRSDTIAYAGRLSSLSGLVGGAITSGLTSAIAAIADSTVDIAGHSDFNVTGTLKQAIDPEANTTSYAYNAFGEVIGQTAPLDGTDTIVSTRTYDRRGLLKTEIVDNPSSPTGHKQITTSYGYDAFGRAIALTDPNSHATVTAYDRAGRVKTVTDALSNATSFAYDARGNLMSSSITVSGSSLVTRYVYDNGGRRIWTVDAAGGVVQALYDDDGRVSVTKAYANAISLSGFGAAITAADITGRLSANSANDVSVRNVYDKDGRLKYVVDGALAVTEYGYDDAGNAIRTTRYGGAIDATTSYTIAYVAGQITSKGLAALSNTRVARAAFDAAGRAAFTIDALGAVVANTYDGAGRLITQRAYDTAYATAGDPSIATMASWASSHGGSSDRISRAVYDRRGQLVYSIDAEGYVTQQIFNKLGSVTKQIRYADAYTVTAPKKPSEMATLIGTLPSSAHVTEFKYDSAGRLNEIVDPLAMRTVMTLDQAGRILTSTIAYGTSEASTTTWTYDEVGRMLTVKAMIDGNSAHDIVTAYSYDALGRQLTVTAANGSGDAVTRTMTYDAAGRLLTVRVPVDGTSGNDLVTTNEYDALGNLRRVNDPRGFDSFYYYDTAGRRIQQVDPEKWVTDTSYTIFGEVASVRQYATKATNTPSVTTAPTVSTNAGDALTVYTYDTDGRLYAVTDAASHSEIYAHNNFGDRTGVTDKLGNQTVYAYDKLGRITQVTLPATSLWSNGSVSSIAAATRFTLDSFGNVTTKVEAYGLPEHRTTGYTYDKLDRLTLTTHEAVTRTKDDLTTDTQTPTESVTYDNRGNVILTVDAGGGKTFSYYDLANRKTDEVNAVGTLSRWTYDARGNVKTQRVYDDAVTLPTSAGGSAPSPAGGGTYRETSYAYDRADRLTTTTVASLKIGAFVSGAYAISTESVSTSLYYDGKAAGVTREADGAGATIFHYYDKAGREVARVDRENYLTVWERDFQGNAKSEVRYATRITGSFSQSSTVAALQTLAGTSAADRTTNFTYSPTGLRLTEARTGVASASVSSTGVLTSTTATATITYTYDALGHVTSKTEATGDVSSFVYNALGQQTLVTQAQMKDSGGTTITPTIATVYDALGSVIRTTQNKTGGSSGNNRTTSYAYGYGAGARLTSVTDAVGFVRNYGYDTAGRVVKESYTRLKSDNSTSVTEATAYRYDVAGRLTLQMQGTWGGSSWSYSPATRIGYNAFGEMIGRGMTAAAGDTAVYQESYAYDAGGRLYRSTEGDGTVKFTLYDKAGNATLAIVSTGTNLGSDTLDDAVARLTNSGANAVGAVAVSGVAATISVYSKRGELIEKREPYRELSWHGSGGTNKSTLVSRRTYNAFGEVATEADARGDGNSDYTTEFAYNTMGRLIEKKSPSISWTSESGSAAAARPTEHYSYDLGGRMVAVEDANGGVTRRLLVGGTGYGEGEEVLVAAEFHADDYSTATLYNEFRDAVIQRDELGHDETFTFDKMGRVLTQAHRGGALTDTYTYDGLGQRTRHYNSQLGSSAVERTDYDLLGRVTLQTDMGGAATAYAYAWDQGIATSGLGTFGGWTKTTTLAGSQTASENKDYFGRITYRSDFGSHGFTYGYDKGGRLTSTGNGSGQSQALTWFNTGLLGKNIDTGGSGYNTITATYGYDAAGNRAYEGYAGTVYSYKYSSGTTSSTLTLENATIAYDAMNRVTGITDKDAGGTTRITIATEYDKAGNVRRVNATYPDLAAGSGSVTTDKWYKYDIMNRMVLVEGQLVSGAIVKGSGYGYDVTYDAAGRRHSQTRFSGLTGLSTHVWQWFEGHGPGFPSEPQDEGENGDYVDVEAAYLGIRREEYAYADDGALTSVSFVETDYTDNHDGTVTAASDPTTVRSAVLRAQYTRDAMDRITQYREYYLDGTTVTRDRSNIVYNSHGGIDTEDNSQVKVESGAHNTYLTHSHNYYDANGNVTSTTSDEWKNGYDDTSLGLPDTSMTYTYDYWDAARIATQTYDRDVDNSGTDWVSTYHYDATGRLSSVGIDDDRDRTVSFAYTPEGQILNRKERSGATANPEDQHVFLSGMEVGLLTNNGGSDPDTVDYAQALTMRNWASNRELSPFRWNSFATTAGTFGGSGYQPLNPDGAGAQTLGARYTVQAGDTLQSIAAASWGDASLWYMIAEANGLSGNAALAEGQSLLIPDRVTNIHNNASTFHVYDPNKSLGDLSPTTAKPPKTGGCGMLGQIIAVVIAEVISHILPPVIGPIVGNIASQLFLMATGDQHGFNWKSLAITAITAGLSGKLLPSGVGTGPIAQIADAVVTNVATQGIAVATGLQKKFSWSGIAVAGVSAGVSLGTGGLLRNAPGLVNRLVSGTAGLAAGAATRSVMTGTDFGDNLIAVLPQVIGQGLAGLGGAQRRLAIGHADGPEIGSDGSRNDIAVTLGRPLSPDVLGDLFAGQGNDLVVTGGQSLDPGVLGDPFTEQASTGVTAVPDLTAAASASTATEPAGDGFSRDAVVTGHRWTAADQVSWARTHFYRSTDGHRMGFSGRARWERSIGQAVANGRLRQWLPSWVRDNGGVRDFGQLVREHTTADNQDINKVVRDLREHGGVLGARVADAIENSQAAYDGDNPGQAAGWIAMHLSVGAVTAVWDGIDFLGHINPFNPENFAPGALLDATAIGSGLRNVVRNVDGYVLATQLGLTNPLTDVGNLLGRGGNAISSWWGRQGELARTGGPMAVINHLSEPIGYILGSSVGPAEANAAREGVVLADWAGIAAEGGSPFERIIANVQTADFSTAPHSALFYSGTGTHEVAEMLASERGLTPISHTPGGSYLESLDMYGPASPLSREEADQIWAHASRLYANGASGDVLAILHNPAPHRIYLSVERPVLLSNPNVNLREMTIPDLFISAGNHH